MSPKIGMNDSHSSLHGVNVNEKFLVRRRKSPQMDDSALSSYTNWYRVEIFTDTEACFSIGACKAVCATAVNGTFLCRSVQLWISICARKILSIAYAP